MLWLSQEDQACAEQQKCVPKGWLQRATSSAAEQIADFELILAVTWTAKRQLILSILDRYFFLPLCSRWVFPRGLQSRTDPFRGPSQWQIMVAVLSSLADVHGLMHGIVRPHCTWEAGLDLCHPHRPRVTLQWEWHMQCSKSHTRAPASATAVNHLAKNPSSKEVLIPATLVILIAWVKRGDFPSETCGRNKATKSWEMDF